MNELLERKALLDELIFGLLSNEDEANYCESSIILMDDNTEQSERVEVETELREVVLLMEAKVSEYFEKLKEANANDSESETL